jgi:large subunit ribosomal protein L7/L12
MTATIISQLGDRIVGLTLPEAQQLSQYLRDVHGIEPAAAKAVQPTDTRRDEPIEPPKTSFDVVLTGYGENKIPVIRALRAITGLALREAKQTVESAPVRIAEALDREEAEELKRKIEEAGGTADLR